MSANRLIEHFADNARACTPAAARSVATVVFMPALNDAGITACCAGVLSEPERHKAEGFLTTDLRARFAQQRAFRRYCGTLAAGAPRHLSQIEFTATVKGCPYLPELPSFWFSFSSYRHGFLGAWSSTHRIGVDIEDHAGSGEAIHLAQRYFSRAEAKAVEDAGNGACLQTFLRLWTLKEAALKSIGEGLPFGLDAFRFDLTAGLRIINAPGAYGGAERFRAFAIDVADSSAALVMHSPTSAVRTMATVDLTSALPALG